MTPADLRAKANEIINAAYASDIVTAVSVDREFARIDTSIDVAAREKLTAFVEALIECAVHFQSTMINEETLAPMFPESEFRLAHEAFKKRQAALSRLEELTK